MLQNFTKDDAIELIVMERQRVCRAKHKNNVTVPCTACLDSSSIDVSTDDTLSFILKPSRHGSIRTSDVKNAVCGLGDVVIHPLCTIAQFSSFDIRKRHRHLVLLTTSPGVQGSPRSRLSCQQAPHTY